jgi:hypothetical protein
MKNIIVALLSLCVPVAACAQLPNATRTSLPSNCGNYTANVIGFHHARYSSDGALLPWTSWRKAIRMEMEWYNRCPTVDGYPRFITVTFMDGNYHWYRKRPDTIPAMQDGMGILSYLKYYNFIGKRNPVYLKIAKQMGDFLVIDCNTPNSGKWPGFTRSTGKVGELPLPADCGSQQDHPYEIQPDKGALAGWALLQLYRATGNKTYLDQALHNARVLVTNMQPGTATTSPWPFRVDYRTGIGRGPVSADMSFALRLFNGLLHQGYPEFTQPASALWSWIVTWQIPSAAGNGALWTQFFEDYDRLDNRNSWSAMNLARYLIEKRDSFDPAWREHAHTLIQFVTKNFTGIRDGVPICGEQDGDREPWGGANSTYGAVLAMYSAATGSHEYELLARESLNFGLYAIDKDGCPGQNALAALRGGWQEDAHTDKIHNYVDAMTAFPNWAR